MFLGTGVLVRFLVPKLGLVSKNPVSFMNMNHLFSRKLCNYTKVLKELNMVGLKGLVNVSCACNSGTFGYGRLGT